MHPGMLYRWKYGRRHAHWHAWAGCGPEAEPDRWEERYDSAPHHHGESMGAAFGVRRPLRYLAYKLQLDERQVSDLARILDELKTERAQAEVDSRRTVSAFADAVAREAFDDGAAVAGASLRVNSAERLRDAVVKTLREIHALLDDAQREKLAYMIRTGALTI